MKPRPDPDPTLTDASSVGGELPILSAGPLFWRSLDERAESGAPRPDQDQELSRSGGAAIRPLQPPRVLAVDGGLAGPGGPERLRDPAHRVDRAVCRSPRADRSGQTAVLQHGGLDGWVCLRRPGREPDGAAHQDRREPRPSGQPGRHRRLRPGRGALVLRPGPLSGGDARRPGRNLGASSRPSCFASRGEVEDQGRRPADLDPDDHLAHAGRPAPAAARAVPGGEVACL